MQEERKRILMLGCFDTKEEDFSFLYDCIRANGEDVITINTGVMETTPTFPVDFGSDIVAGECGESLDDLRKKGDRGHAVGVMGDGAAKVVAKLVGQNKIKGAIGMGGGGGSTIAFKAMQEIPIGIPKLCLTTLAGKDVARQIGSKDITLIPSIVDVAGLNSISTPLIMQAAAAICAMGNVRHPEKKDSAGCIAVSMFGNTSVCVDRCSELLRAKGYEVFAFHANGVGGKAMESLIREGCFSAVLDITTTELADELCGGICSAGPDRLSAATEAGIPQVVVPGCLDMVNFAQLDTVPQTYRHRDLYSWSPDVTLMRTNKEENKILGERFSEKVSHSGAPAAVLIPTKGISQIDKEGGIFYQPEINRVLFDTIKEKMVSSIEVIEVNAHINDEQFSKTLVSVLLELLEKHAKT